MLGVPRSKESSLILLKKRNFKALANAISEVVWIKSLLIELRVTLTRAPVIECVYTNGIAHFTNPVHHARMKHVELYSVLCLGKGGGWFNSSELCSSSQPSGLWSKPLSSTFFIRLRQKLGVSSPLKVAGFSTHLGDAEEREE